MSASKKSQKNGPKQERELLETCQRLQAEFENYKKRAEKERDQWRVWTKRELLGPVLPIVDHLEIALKAHELKEDQFYKGIEMIYGQIMAYLKEQGVEPIAAEGERFDAQRHEAILTEDQSDLEPNTILEVMQQGYSVDGMLLRTAKVKVSKNNAQKSENSNENQK